MKKKNSILFALSLFSFPIITMAQSDFGHGRINLQTNSVGSDGNTRTSGSSGSGSGSSHSTTSSSHSSNSDRTPSTYNTNTNTNTNTSSSNSNSGSGSHHSSSSSSSSSNSDSDANTSPESNSGSYSSPSTYSPSTYSPSTYSGNSSNFLQSIFSSPNQNASQTYSAPTSQASSYNDVLNLEKSWLNMHNKYITNSEQSIAPPFEGVDIAYETFKIDAQKGGKIQFENGSTIKVPKDAFVDAKGNRIQGEVEMKYREFHDAADIIASGIPMHDPKTGQYMETAGMFELKGESAGTPIEIASGKEVEVKMASSNPGNNFDFWQYDEESKGWQEIDGAGQISAKHNSQQTRTGATRGNSTVGTTGGSDANPSSTKPSTNPNFSPDYTRSFGLSSMGLHNWDALRGQISRTLSNNTKQVDIVFDEQAGLANKEYKKVRFFWVTREGRSVLPYAANEVRYANFTPYSNDLLVALLPNNKVATFTGKDFGKLNQSDDVLIYNFKTHPQAITDMSELKTVFGY